jgi:hypothetical protein
LAVASVAIVAGDRVRAAEESPRAAASYGEVRKFLAGKTLLYELTDQSGARVAICPQWQGRVMTSTCGGLEGPSFGFVHREFIDQNQPNAHFNNFGGENRMWLSPEGGQFSLWFKPGAKQNLDNWYTPPAFNEGPWNIVSRPTEPLCMAATMKFQNASGTPFHLEVSRAVRLLSPTDLAGLFGPALPRAIAQQGVRSVAYETADQLTNRGPEMTKQTGLVSIWVLGMFNCGPQTVVIVPYKPGAEAELGPVVKSDYFGPVPAERLKVLPAVMLFRADGNCRSKIGVSQRRARNVLGSIDFRAGVLTLVQFGMSSDPTKQLYMNNMWGGPHSEPYVGDVVNSYNDGPPAPGQKGLGPFYEIESLSPAKVLGTGQSLEHRHRTLHIQADLGTLDRLAQEILGVDLATVRREMSLPPRIGP